MLGVLAFVPTTQIMILGTYHFANPGLDAVKTQIRDTMSAGRQREIEELVERLAKFHPTKIAIEATPERGPEINQRLARYLSGGYELTPNEIDQVAFRLAKRCGLSALLAIDNKLDLDFDGVFRFLGEHDPARAEELGALLKRIGPTLEGWDRSYSVSQILAIHNSPWYIEESHRFYVSLCDASDGKVFPGADMLGDWYKRNARIYGALRRSIRKGDRVLVLYGSGHAKILRDFVKQSGPEFELVEASTYLPKCPVAPLEF